MGDLLTLTSSDSLNTVGLGLASILYRAHIHNYSIAFEADLRLPTGEIRPRKDVIPFNNILTVTQTHQH